MTNTFAVVGMWSGGLYLCRYAEETGEWTPVALFGEKEIQCGFQAWDEKRKLLYATDEVRTRKGLGGGGYAQAWKLDPAAEKLECVSSVNTLAENPSWICREPSCEYALVTHFCAQFGGFTKIVRNDDGTFSSRTDVSDAALVLMRLDADGFFGEVMDAVVHTGSGEPGPGAVSHLHSVVCDPSGELFTVCDMGTDRVYSYHLDRSEGRLQYLGSTPTEKGSEPRYQVFDPNKPFLYANFEGTPAVCSYRYDVKTGALEKAGECRTLPEELKPEGKPFAPADLILSGDGRTLYSPVRIANQIGVVHVDDDGTLTRIQSIDAGGAKPKGLAISPDGRFLFSANGDSGNVTRFRILADGTLAADGVAAELGGSPGNIVLIRSGV